MMPPDPTVAEMLQHVADLVPCPDCLLDPGAALHGQAVEAVYCSHRGAGLSLAGGQFMLVAPIALPEFRAMVAAVDLKLEAAAPAAPLPN